MFDEVRAAMFALVSHPWALAALILLAGIHTAVWLLVFERIGYPPVLAVLLLVPPLTLFMPAVLAFLHWPAPETTRFTKRFRKAPAQAQPRRFVRRARPASPLPPQESFGGRRPLILAADGLPRTRISLGASPDDTLFRPHDSTSMINQWPSWGS